MINGVWKTNFLSTSVSIEMQHLSNIRIKMLLLKCCTLYKTQFTLKMCESCNLFSMLCNIFTLKLVIFVSYWLISIALCLLNILKFQYLHVVTHFGVATTWIHFNKHLIIDKYKADNQNLLESNSQFNQYLIGNITLVMIIVFYEYW